MHLHVGQNIPGYLPEGDIGCFDDPDDAADHLEDQLEQIEGSYFECCPNGTVLPGTNDQNCDCAWCEVAWDVYADRLPDGPLRTNVEHYGAWSVIYSPPEGPDLVLWAQTVSGDQDDCEIYAEQDY